MESAARIAGRAVSAAINRIMTRLLIPYNAEHLQRAISEHLTIFTFIQRKVEDYRQHPEKWTKEKVERLKAVLKAVSVVRGMLRRISPDLVREYLTVEHGVNWVRKHRPDVLHIIDTAEGHEWLQLQIDEVYRWLYGK